MIGKFEWDGKFLTYKTEISQELLEELRSIVAIDPESELRKILVEEYENDLNTFCDSILDAIKVYKLTQPPREAPATKDYVSDRVFEGKRPLTPDRRKLLLDLLAESQEPLGAEFQKVLDDNMWELYDGEGVSPMKEPSEEVFKIKEKYKNADRDLLKNIQAIHGKEEGLRQYNEIMAREEQYRKNKEE
jgi:hypothetical protein